MQLQETEYSDQKLYAKIGCMERETYTSTKLQLHVYTDQQCSQTYDDGQTDKRHVTKGYEINGYYFSTKVSFRPSFYTCDSCTPKQISGTFNKKNGNWYDDDYISQHGKKQGQNNDDAAAGNNGDDYYGDDYFNDDTYMNANDDVARDDDGGNNNNNNNNNNGGGDDGDDGGNGGDDGNNDGGGDDYYGNDDDDSNRRLLMGSTSSLPQLLAVPGELEVS